MDYNVLERYQGPYTTGDNMKNNSHDETVEDVNYVNFKTRKTFLFLGSLFAIILVLGWYNFSLNHLGT